LCSALWRRIKQRKTSVNPRGVLRLYHLTSISSLEPCYQPCYFLRLPVSLLLPLFGLFRCVSPYIHCSLSNRYGIARRSHSTLVAPSREDTSAEVAAHPRGHLNNNNRERTKRVWTAQPNFSLQSAFFTREEGLVINSNAHNRGQLTISIPISLRA